MHSRWPFINGWQNILQNPSKIYWQVAGGDSWEAFSLLSPSVVLAELPSPCDPGEMHCYPVVSMATCGALYWPEFAVLQVCLSLPQTIAIMFMNLNLRVVQRAWLPQLSILTCVQPVFSFTLGGLLCSLKPLSEKHVFIFLSTVPFKYLSMKMSHWGWLHHG